MMILFTHDVTIVVVLVAVVVDGKQDIKLLESDGISSGFHNSENSEISSSDVVTKSHPQQTSILACKSEEQLNCTYSFQTIID
ncbi:hypothetical protein M8J75_014794 [Diaphorina citri]|nr:hypothetical protein M8J75_014794 [Diaphorina citri]KAI5753424.1 hypothetical protein M8J77_000089 [Diaphorina citri]